VKKNRPASYGAVGIFHYSSAKSSGHLHEPRERPSKPVSTCALDFSFTLSFVFCGDVFGGYRRVRWCSATLSFRASAPCSFADRIGARLAIGWTMRHPGFRTGASYLSAQIDLPPAHAIVVTFGGVLHRDVPGPPDLASRREARQLDGAAAAHREV